MKKIIKDLLWYILNKLDPLSIKSMEINNTQISITFNKDFWEVDKWNHLSATILCCLKVDSESKKTLMDNIFVYKDTEIKNNFSVKRDI